MLLVACANAATVEKEPIDSGISQSFKASPESVREAVLTSLVTMDHIVQDERKTDENYVIYVTRRTGVFVLGSVGRVVIDKKAAPLTAVHVIYEKRYQLQQFSSEGRFARRLFGYVEQKLALDSPSRI